MKERFRTSDYRFIFVCLALAAVTTWFSVGNFYRAFPEASIDFRVDREEGRRLAANFLRGQEYHAELYRQAASFTFDDDAKTFLEREAGLEQANRLMGTRVRLWRWSYRWFRPLQKEEFRADVTPLGDVAGFSHQIPEDAARNDPGAARARDLAEEFLRTKMGRDPGALDFIEESDSARPHRMDRAFTWKERDFDLHDATYRVEVTLLGDEVGGYREYLKVPEQWTRDYARLRSKNQAAEFADSALTVALVVGLLVVIVMRLRRQDIRWRLASVFGVGGMVLSFCSQLNQFSLQEFGYPTTDSYASFASRELLNAAIASLGWGGLLFVLAAGAEPLYRESFGGQISLGNLFSLRGLRTRRFFLGALLGISLTAIFIAYQTAFYIVAYRYGAWSPADVPYSDLLNTRFPWLFVLFGGYMPAIFEEFLFRMFAIPFLRKLARSTIVALVAAGFLWGFGHAAYPQQPFYIRGVEVGIGGVALGIIMLRWGILPTLVWHYSVDAMYSAMLLMRSHSTYYKLSGAASAGIIVLPVVVALVAYWRRGGFEPEAGLLNADEAVAEEAKPVQAEERAAAERAGYHPLAARMRWIALALMAIGVVCFAIPAHRFGASPAFEIPDQQARAASDAYLRAQGFDPAPFQAVTVPAAREDGPDSLAMKYFLERRPVTEASRLFEEYRPVRYWLTRYFKSLDQEEVSVAAHPATGKVLSFVHTLPDARPGADLPADAAQRTAVAFAAGRGVDLSKMELKDSGSEKKKARRDYELEWEAPPGDGRNVDEARFRVHMEVDGDQVTALRSYWKLPESYARERSRQNAISVGSTTLRIIVIAALAVCAILLLVRHIRSGQVPWRAAIRVGVPIGLLTGLTPLLARRQLLLAYPTAIPFETYEAMTYMIAAMSLVFGLVLAVSAVAILMSYYPESFPALRAAYRRIYARDAAIGLIAVAGLAMITHRLQVFLLDRFHGAALGAAGDPEILVNSAPALTAVAGALRTVVLDGAIIGTIVLIARYLRKPWQFALIGAAVMFVMVPTGVRTPSELGLYFAIALAGAAAAVIFCLYFARENYLAYAVALWCWAMRGPLFDLFSNPLPGLAIHRWLVAAALAGGVVWALYPGLRREPKAA